MHEGLTSARHPGPASVALLVVVPLTCAGGAQARAPGVDAAALQAQTKPVAPVDALHFYDADGRPSDVLPGAFPDEKAVKPDFIAQNGWGRPNLVLKPAAPAGRLAAFESAAPLAFSRADPDAAVLIDVKDPAVKGGTVSGVLEPTGLGFQREVPLDSRGRIRIPIPAAVLPPGDYTLKVRLKVGDRTECALLPIVVGPYLHYDRYHAYSWNAGGSNEAQLAAQMRLNRLAGLDVLDTAYLPAAAALREGLLVSAHYVTVYQGTIKDRYAAVAPVLTMAREEAAAIGRLAQRWPHIRWCLPNSEYGAAHILKHPEFARRMKKEIGVAPADLRINTANYPVPARTLPALAPGVYSHRLKELEAYRFACREGCGWFRVNRLSMEVMRGFAPQLRMWTDPLVAVEQFEGFDAVSFWHYPANPWDLLSHIKRAECYRRINGAGEVYVTLSQWFSGVRGATNGWAMRSPDNHRFDAWLVVSEPTDMIGYWQIGELPKHPDCAAGLRNAMNEVVYPYGTLLRGTTPVPGPVALYLSSAGEFLSRADRPHNFWFHTHYLNGVRPALVERFKGRVAVLDDADILAGRHKGYRVLLCPLFRATTDRLRDQLKAYQAAGGTIVGDTLWRANGLKPDDVFPGKDSTDRGIPYANAELARWHMANRDDIMKWTPRAQGREDRAFALDSPSPDVMLSLRTMDDVLYAVIVNARFVQGKWAKRFGIADPGYRDTGQTQETDVTIRAAAGAVVYDATRSRRLAEKEYTRSGDRIRIPTRLPAAGAAVYVLRPRPIASLRLDTGAAGKVRAGSAVYLRVNLLDDRGAPIGGQTVVDLSVRDSTGTRQDVSGLYPVRAGAVVVPFGVNLDARHGEWQVRARDLTSGLEQAITVTVTSRPTRASGRAGSATDR